MQISKIQTNFQLPNYQNKKEIQKTNTTNVINRGLGYPKGYTPFFGARLFRTPENFYAQKFNKKGMPKTMADYLNSNYAVNSKKPPAQLTKEAFENLVYCESIEDVKEMFPDEPLFKDLKSLDDARPTGGYLFQMRAYGYKNNTVLQSSEDLTVYLLKKIFLESKDIDEINADFDKDRKQDEELVRDEEYCNEDIYFLPSTLKALGIKLPDKSYWKSLQANRTDKQYTPYTYVLKHPRKKPEFTKPRERKPLNLSPEEIQKRKDRMIDRWINMTPEQRQAQLAKMKEGQADSLLFQYASPIMYIATDKAKFQDKMYHFFKEHKKELKTDAPEDLSNLSSKQARAMQKFWDANPKLKKSFAYFIRATLFEFEKAKEQGDEALGELLGKAATIRDRNNEKAHERKLRDSENTRADLKALLESQIFPFPDSYGDKYLNFVLKHSVYESRIIPLRVKTMLAKSEEEKEKHIRTSLEIMTGVFNEFNKKNKKDGISSIASLASVIFPLLETSAETAQQMGHNNTAVKIINDANEMLTGNPTCILGMVEKYSSMGSKDLIKKFKRLINISMEKYSSGYSDEELRKVSNAIIEYMRKISEEWGNYRMLSNPVIRKRCSDKITRTHKAINKNKDARRSFMEFVRDYEGLLKFSEDLIANGLKSEIQNGFGINFDKMLRYKNIRDYLYESIIDDYLT